MSFMSVCRLFNLQKTQIFPIQCIMQTSSYSELPGKGMKSAPKVMKVARKSDLPVETDIDKLLTYACGTNIYKEGHDVKLKPDSEYPDWLWTIRTGRPARLNELDPNTKQYWRKLRKIGMERLRMIKASKKF